MLLVRMSESVATVQNLRMLVGSIDWCLPRCRAVSADAGRAHEVVIVRGIQLLPRQCLGLRYECFALDGWFGHRPFPAGCLVAQEVFE